MQMPQRTTGVKVTVKLQGAVRPVAGSEVSSPLELILPDKATVGDLLHDLAERLSGPFREVVEAAGQELPPALRLFVDGELALNPAQPLAVRDALSPTVIVVIMAPMMGGAP